MILGVLKESYPGERRVAIIPAVVPLLTKAGFEVMAQAGAGEEAGYPDSEYEAKGVKLAKQREDVFASAAIICQVRTLGANPQRGQADLPLYRRELIVIGLADPLGDAATIKRLAETGVRSFAMELIPRITRAQSMDVLSSQATVAGYKAVLLAAEHLPRLFPMMMTAAGTISAAKVFVIGAGVAGLQAIASAKKLGAVVQAYDVRPVVKEQVESLGAKFVQLDLATSGAEDKGGYAKAMDEEFYRKQRDMMGKVVAQSDVVITTAAVPGAKAPVLVTGEMVRSMPFGSVVIDLAARPLAEGGNCDLTRPDDIVVVPDNRAKVLGPTNLPSTVPFTASQMFAKNTATFVTTLVKNGQLNVDMNDEIIAQTLLTQDGAIVNARVKEILKSGLGT
jgi:NAD(P) transhydrogenase subunit alpha